MGAAASAGDEEDEALARVAAVRLRESIARFGAIGIARCSGRQRAYTFAPHYISGNRGSSYSQDVDSGRRTPAHLRSFHTFARLIHHFARLGLD